MAFVLGKSVGRQIAEALGMDGRHVGRIVLDIPAHGVVKVYVEALPEVDEAALVKAIAEGKAAGEVEAEPCHQVFVLPPGASPTRIIPR